MDAVELTEHSALFHLNDLKQTYETQRFEQEGLETSPESVLERLKAAKRKSRKWSALLQDWWNEAKDICINRKSLVVSVGVLLLSVTAERVTFKMSVDIMIPFRLFLAQVFVIASFAVYGSIALYKVWRTDLITPRMWLFPKKTLLGMAIIDTISFAGLVISAADVTPTMTVILLHISTPVVVFTSQWVFPDRKYSPLQSRGAWLIALAVLLCVLRPIMELLQGQELHAAICGLVYVFSAALQGLGTLYKEKAIIDWSQQLDIHFLSAWLFFFQTLTMVVLSPLLFPLQGLSGEAAEYQLSSLPTNFREGMYCLFKFGPLQLDGYHSSGQPAVDCGCNGSLALVCVYVISNVVMLECIDNVLQTSNKILGRVMAAAVFVAFLALGVYDNTMDLKDYTRLFGTVGYADLLAILVLLVGIDYNGSDAEPNVEMITSYDPVEDPDAPDEAA